MRRGLLPAPIQITAVAPSFIQKNRPDATPGGQLDMSSHTLNQPRPA